MLLRRSDKSKPEPGDSSFPSQVDVLCFGVGVFSWGEDKVIWGRGSCLFLPPFFVGFMGTFDALSFVRDYNISHWTEGNNVQPGWINVQCPLCEDKSNHGGFNPSEGYYNCWRCGGHSLKYVISRLLGVDKNLAEKIVFEYSGRSYLLSKLNKKIPRATQVTPPGESLQTIHRKYLIRRNFDPDYIEKKYQIVGTGPAGEYKFRLIIPLYFQDRIISFQGRDITDKQKLRYKNCPVEESILHYKDILYNIDSVSGNRIAVVEGVFDAWRMGDGFVATFGTAITECQISLLSKYQYIQFLFDSEPEAQEKAKKAANKLSSVGCNVEIIDLEMKEDPGDLSNKQARRIRREIGW
jgi:hypothetical protein